MDNFDRKLTDQLLAVLDNEIEQKCLELKENRKNVWLRQVFFLSCLLTIIVFGFNIYSGFQFIRTLVYLFLFQSAALILLIPLVINLNGGQSDVPRIR